jgi:hypothetical protein
MTVRDMSDATISTVTVTDLVLGDCRCTRVLQHMSTESVSTFIDRHLLLLSQERDAEVERTSLVFSKCGPKQLEQKGLALNGLGIASIGVGLGNKTCVHM